MISAPVFLTGFMGSGKTTLGKKLAALMNADFIDLDAEIEKQLGQSITAIFETRGENFFRETESRVLSGILKMPGTFVVSLGGGTICYGDNLEALKSRGILVYLELPEKVLADRLAANRSGRPLIKDLDMQGLSGFISEKLQARVLYYRQAHITANGLNLTAQRLYRQILDAYPKNT